MSNANISQFLQTVMRDANLQEMLRAAVAASGVDNRQSALAAVAREHGYDIKPEDLNSVELLNALTELDLKQLDAVSGGNYSSQNFNSPFD